LSEEKDRELIDIFLYNPKVDLFFNVVFGNPENNDVASSLIRAVLPEEEEIDNLTFEKIEMFSSRRTSPNRSVIIDIYAKDNKTNKNYIIEIHVYKIKDIMVHSGLTEASILHEFYKTGECTVLNQKIFCINFLFFDQYPEDEDYYHHLFTHKYNKKNVSLPFNNVIVIELKKFKEKFNISQIKDELLNNGIYDRKLERKLWFAFLSFINTTYNKTKDKDNHSKTEVTKSVNSIKNEISEDLYKILIKQSSIKKAFDIFENLNEREINQYIDVFDINNKLAIEKKATKEELKKTKEEFNKKNDTQIKINDILNKRNDIINKLDNNLNEKNNIINEQNDIINKLDDNLNEKNDIINKQNNIINEKNDIINKQNNIINEQNNIINEKNNIINEKNDIINEQNNIINEQNDIINEQNDIINGNKKVIHNSKVGLKRENEITDNNINNKKTKLN